MTSNISFRRRTLLKAGLAGGLVAASGLRVAAAPSQFKTVEPGFLTVAALGELPASGIDVDRLTGTDGEIITAIAEKLGLKVKPALVDNAGTIEAVRSGRADLMLGNMRWTAKRAEVIALSDPAYYVTYGVITQSDRKLPDVLKVSDISGLRAGTLTGASSSADLKKIPNIADVKFYDNSEAVIRDLTSGRLDFGVLDPTLIAFETKRKPDLKLKHVVFEPDAEFAILTGRSQSVFGLNFNNPDLLDAVNAGLKWAASSGKSREIFDKYGLSDPAYFQPLAKDPRVGVDRDPSGKVLGPSAHDPKDFSGLFA
ncbi:transporter substrate-binding domain-containing protein [Rhizobium lusitanum]|uniref:Transporter substrate-binding domain-containing protein n=1 Tax=Rhizobium lusitanum TaxID=293958 RepID=A0A6L9UG58_9HYPH|nr:transporter substrate-binding domain-containing protein [Rhizobium lusitanum]NEI73598.1 transporter substrate-binding domain-containing protein [Rhizobium lusitanum]